MARTHTHYDNLKVARNAPPEVIRAAYKTLSQKYHPDHNPDNPDAMRIIQIINSAYEVLSDPIKRQEHDKWIARTEALDQETGVDRNPNFYSNRAPNRASESSHRRAHFDIRASRYELTFKVLKIVQKTRRMLDHFFRYLSRKA